MAKENTIKLKSMYTSIMKQNPMMYGNQFIVTFSGSDLPGNLRSTGQNMASITYYVKSATIPAVTIQESSVSFLSQKFVLPRQVSFGDSWNVKVLLDQNMTHYKTLYDWQQTFASLQLDGGGKKVIPNVQAHVSLLDPTYQYVIHRFTLDGVFPSNIPDLAMQYQNNSTMVDFQCTFTYQFLYDEAGGNPMDS